MAGNCLTHVSQTRLDVLSRVDCADESRALTSTGRTTQTP
jgi:hypothetical protein